MLPDGVRYSLAPNSTLSSGWMTITGTAMAARLTAAAAEGQGRQTGAR